MNIINTLLDINISDIESLKEYWNLNLLKQIYFIPKNVSNDLINKVNLNDYLKTNEYLNNNDIKSQCEDLIHEFELDTSFTANNETLYIILGLNTSTIYSTKYNDKEISVLCIEAINARYDYLKSLLAHEYTHFIRKRLLNKDIFNSSLAERIIAEGIAENYSYEMVNDLSVAEYCLVDNNTVDHVNKNIDKIDNLIRDNYENKELINIFFDKNAKIDFPKRCGNVYAYYLIRDYLNNNNLNIKDILDIDYKDIFKGA